MAKYLDYAGLQYLWTKIKNYVSTQPLGANVRYDAQTLTTAQQAQARKNIAAGGTNPNLLDNPWWGSGEVVNQRGVTSGNTDHLAYNIDRWQTSYGSVKGTWSLSANGLTISASDVAYNQQKIENYAELNGKTVTASVMTSDGVVHSGTVTNLNWASNPIAFTDGNLRCQLASGGIFRVTSLNGSSNTIRAVKLELGSVSTLANDVPPDYGTELAKCQRYFVRALGDPFGTGYITNAGNNSRITVPVPMTMRATPTVSFSGTFHLRVQGNTLNVTTMSAVSPKNTAGGITLLCSGFSGATTGLCALYADGTSDYIDFSADL